jgi:uncharacterized protein YcbK (DUF882 family)
MWSVAGLVWAGLATAPITSTSAFAGAFVQDSDFTYDGPSSKRRSSKTSDEDDSSSQSASNDDDDETPKKRKSAKKVRVASLGDSNSYSSPPPKVSSGNVSWVASSGCLPSRLKSVIYEAASYGSITVSSTGRSKSHNSSVGGASRSYHLACQAADFRVHGNWGAASAFLRNHGDVGGFKHYGGGLFHIDTGPRRSW